METPSAEAGLDAMVLTCGRACIRGGDAETVDLKQRRPNEEQQRGAGLGGVITVNVTRSSSPRETLAPPPGGDEQAAWER